MALSAARVVSVGETPYAHEKAGIDFAIAELPDRDPFYLWALVDLLDTSTGRLLELDLIIMGYSAIYLVELKGGPGIYKGDSVDWWRTPPGDRPRYMENPRRLTQRKAQVLASRLKTALPAGMRAPWIEPLVFLSHEDVSLQLSRDGLIGVLTRKDFEPAITQHEFPGAPASWRRERIDRPAQRAVVKAFHELGLRPRKGKMHVGPYELGSIVDETDSYQDRIATHRDIRSQRRRART